MNSKTIVLLTDFGSNSPYPAIMKGVILRESPGATIIDLCNSVRQFDVLEAQFLLKYSYRHFPEGTIFLAVVDPGVGSERRAIYVFDGHYHFVGPDNGIFSFLFEKPYKAYEVSSSNAPSRTFHGRDIFAPFAAKLSNGSIKRSTLKEIFDPVSIKLPEPVEEENTIEGEIIYVDQFGNLITNIHGTHLNSAKEIKIKGLTINLFVNCYAEAPPAFPIALVNSFDLIEIAFREESATRKLNAGIGEKVTLVKSPSASSQTPQKQ